MKLRNSLIFMVQILLSFIIFFNPYEYVMEICMQKSVGFANIVVKGTNPREKINVKFGSAKIAVKSTEKISKRISSCSRELLQ